MDLIRIHCVGSRHRGVDVLMIIPPANMQVYLALGHTDMRTAINGLSVLVENSMQLNPFSGSNQYTTSSTDLSSSALAAHAGICAGMPGNRHFYRDPKYG